jgi:hypothetical protein
MQLENGETCHHHDFFAYYVLMFVLTQSQVGHLLTQMAGESYFLGVFGFLFVSICVTAVFSFHLFFASWRWVRWG